MIRLTMLLTLAVAMTGCFGWGDDELPDYNGDERFEEVVANALKGKPIAMVVIAGWLQDGDGVGRDYVEAYRWARAAARCGRGLGSDNMDQLERLMTEAQRNEAARPGPQDRIECHPRP